MKVLCVVVSQAKTLEGKMVRIVDGDTLVLLDQNNTQHRVRLSGINTPERGQPFGRRASQNLARLAAVLQCLTRTQAIACALRLAAKHHRRAEPGIVMLKEH